MRSSKKPAKPKAKRPRGRPEERLVIQPDRVEGILDGILRKRPAQEPATEGPIVRSKRKRPS